MSSNHTEQSKRDKIKSVLLLKNNTYKVTCVAFKWNINEEKHSFHVIFAYSTFYNNTGKEFINKKQIPLTSIKRLKNKPFIQEVFVDKYVNKKITYKTVYDWLKKI